MLKVMAFITRRPDLSHQEFLAYWRSTHVQHVCALPGVRRYQQNHAIEHRATWPFDGVAEVWFDGLPEISEAFRGDLADAMRRDEENFIGEMTWLIAEEHNIDELKEALR